MNTKTCRMCCSEIADAARICPHCRHPQGWLSVGRWAVSSIFLVAMLGVILWGRTTVSTTLDPPKYSAHLGALRVKSSEMVYNLEGQCPTLTTFGTVVNASDIPWKDLQIEVRYFNKAGALVDAQSEDAYRSFVPANGEGAFRLQMKPARAKE
jgi:hypothetical protein